MITQRVDALIDQLPSEGDIDFRAGLCATAAAASDGPRAGLSGRRIFPSWRLGVKLRSCPLFMGKAT
jgi:hypothetical protein